MSWRRWHDGTVTLQLVSGVTITLNGGARTLANADGYVEDYEVRGDDEWLLLPPIDRVDAISVTSEAPTDD